MRTLRRDVYRKKYHVIDNTFANYEKPKED
jgi:hypothetical protein